MATPNRRPAIHACTVEPAHRALTLADELTCGAALLIDAATLVGRAGIATSDSDGAEWTAAAIRHLRDAAKLLMDIPPPREAAAAVGRARGGVMAIEEAVLDAGGRVDPDLLIEELELLRLLRFACERVLADVLGGRPGASGAADVATTSAAALADELVRVFSPNRRRSDPHCP